MPSFDDKKWKIFADLKDRPKLNLIFKGVISTEIALLVKGQILSKIVLFVGKMEI